MDAKKFTVFLRYIYKIVLMVVLLPMTEWVVMGQNVNRPIETELSFPRDISSPNVNFNLQSTGNKKFRITLDRKTPQLTDVKIYDILGNLILHDKIRPEDGIHKYYDFSHISSKLFVVEVGNSKYNKTKSIYADPQGSRDTDKNTLER
ncbi:hypothetical protein [Negadavirga shengliensis]|uniref:Secretion system C-terminal sorting domain-containing protein n=1 Tax=Negadavirga shengliensis TaxID=1389218 RepID=A0ABV9T3J8_9BACT